MGIRGRGPPQSLQADCSCSESKPQTTLDSHSPGYAVPGPSDVAMCPMLNEKHLLLQEVARGMEKNPEQDRDQNKVHFQATEEVLALRKE